MWYYAHVCKSTLKVADIIKIIPHLQVQTYITFFPTTPISVHVFDRSGKRPGKPDSTTSVHTTGMIVPISVNNDSVTWRYLAIVTTGNHQVKCLQTKVSISFIPVTENLKGTSGRCLLYVF